MTYNEFIQNIIDTRGQWNIPDGEYFERHHIVPKCMGGSDNNENIIWLYAGEHYIAHKLLAEENSSNNSIVAAFRIMTNCTSSLLNSRNYEVTSEDYELCRSLWSNSHSNYMKQYSKLAKLNKTGIFSDSAREKSRLSRIGSKHPHTKEQDENIGKSNSGRQYFNNGHDNVFTFECPEGFSPGRIINYDDSKRINAIKEKQKKKVICLDTGIIYDSIAEACESTGASHIGKVCSGKLKQSGGLHWAFYTSELVIKDNVEEVSLFD